MRFRRPERVVAASLLTALGACLALLAQPSAASPLDSYDIRASVRYGCAQHGEDSFVEVGLHAIGRDDDADRDLVLQVGLAGPESTDGSTTVFPEGGPSLVTLGDKPIKVRLAGPVRDGDHVFLRQLDSPEIVNLPLQETCHRIKPTNFGLAEAAVHVTAKSCTSGSQANLQVTLHNPNEVDRQLEKIGIEQIDYTVLLVRQDGQLAGTDPVGTLISFDEPSASIITLSQVVAKPARYEVRVIALDGAVVTSDSIRLSCASTGNPGPSSTSRPSPSGSVTLPPSWTRTPSSPAPTVTVTTTPRPTSSAPVSSPPASSAPASSAPASSAPASSAPVTSTPSVTRQPSPPATSSPAAGVPGPTASSSPSRSSVPARPSSSAAQPTSAAPSSSSATSSAAAAPSSTAPSTDPSIVRLVEPRANYGGLPVFQRDAALVVLIFSAAMTALVGSSVINARRR